MRGGLEAIGKMGKLLREARIFSKRSMRQSDLYSAQSLSDLGGIRLAIASPGLVRASLKPTCGAL